MLVPRKRKCVERQIGARNKSVSVAPDRLMSLIQDALAQKRVIKWGYVRAFGGLYASECDSVASHGHAVTVLAAVLAYEYEVEIKKATDVSINISDVLLMAMLHDFGEGRSGDTGASSHGIRGYCDLHALEKEALSESLRDLVVHDRALKLFDDYRAYRTPEAILVHIADNLEGFEKGIHSSRGTGPILSDVRRILLENLKIYQDRAEHGDKLHSITTFLVENILLPGVSGICKVYNVNLDVDQLWQNADFE